MPVVTDYTALLSGESWAGLERTGKPVFVTYSFATAAPASHGAGDVMGGAVASFQALDAADQAQARVALDAWGGACGLTFLEVKPGEGDIDFAWYDFSGTQWDGAAGVAYYPFGHWNGWSYPHFFDHQTLFDASGDVFLNLDYAQAGLPAYGLLLHEIGHALGLKHPFEVFGAHDQTLAPALDNTASTVMSYTGPSPTQLGMLDVDAVVALYGAAGSDGSQVASWSWNASKRLLTQNGFATADTLLGVSTGDRMNGNGGDDVLLGIDGKDMLAGGEGNDSLWGGSGVDTLNGEAGADRLWGGDGNDRLTGGAGNDTLWGGAGKDRYIYAGGFGADAIADFGDRKDKIDVSAVPGVTGFASLGIAADGFGGSIVTIAGQGTIAVWNTAPTALTAADFIFA